MKVIAINGSPRQNGNTVVLLEQAKEEQLPLDCRAAYDLGVKLAE